MSSASAVAPPDPLTVLKREVAELAQTLNKIIAGGGGSGGANGTPHNTEYKPLSSQAPENKNDHQIRERKVLRGHFGKIYALNWCANTQHADRLVSASQDGRLIIWNATYLHKLNVIPLTSVWVMTCGYSPNAKLVACGGLTNTCEVFTAESKQPADSTLSSPPPKPILELSSASRDSKVSGGRNVHDGYLASCRFVNDSQILTCSGDTLCALWDIGQSEGRLSAVFEGHSQDVMAACPLGSQNPNIFVSGGVDATAMVWDMRDSKGPVQTHEGHESDINSVCGFPDGWCFGTASDDSKCMLWDLRAWSQINSYHAYEIVTTSTSLAFSSSGGYLLAGYDDCCVRVWDTLSAKLIRSSSGAALGLQGHEKRVSCLGVNANGSGLATGSWDSMLRVWA